MHGCCSGSALLVNAEVDSMGGVVDGGVGIGVKTSMPRAAVEKAQADLRQEYDIREERRRELEFLEKGGNPLDFKFRNAVSVSIQSTSLTDHPAEHLVISEAKGSFALTASPLGDSVESSGRPGVDTVYEPNSADNLLLFNGENEPLEVKRKPKHPCGRNNVAPSEHSSRTGGTKNAKEAEDSAIFRPYARRNRSRPNRDGVRSSSTDVVQSDVVHGSSLPARGLPRDVKGVSESNNQKNLIVKGISESIDQKSLNATSVSKPKLATSNGDMVSRTSNQSSSKLDGMQSAEVITRHGKGSVTDGRLNVTASVSVRDNQKDQLSDVGAQQIPATMALEEPDVVGGNESEVGVDPVCPPCPPMEKAKNETGPVQLNGFGALKGDRRSMGNEAQNSHLAFGTKVLDSESSCSQNTQSLDINNDNEVCIKRKIVNTNGISEDEKLEHEGTQNLANVEMVHGKNELDAVGSSAVVNEGHDSFYQDNTGNDSLVKVEEEMLASKFDMENAAKKTNMEGVQQKDNIVSETDVKKVGNLVGDKSNLITENLSSGIPQGSVGCFVHELPETTLSGRIFAAAPDLQTCSSNHSKLADKAREDSILEEARTIEAKRKRIAELSIGTSTSEIRRKSHWDFVLEEMAWLANDFAQERLWKMTAAAQVCRRVACTSRTRSEEHDQCSKVKKVAHTIAKAVMQFWHSAEALLKSDGPNNCKHDVAVSRKVDGDETSTYKSRELEKEAGKVLEVQRSGENIAFPVQAYAVRFLKYISSPVPSIQAEAPATPDRISDLGTMDMSWDDHLTEESLFYAVPSGAMEGYRKSIVSHVMQCEKTGNSLQEEVETSMHDAVAEFGYHESAYDEDEGETSAYYLPGPLESSKPSKSAQKKRRNIMRSYNARSYEAGADLPYGHGTVGYQHPMLLGKRPANSLNVGSIPTKRMRTASRQRVISPFGVGATGVLQATTKTDASSGDTSSYQDDQITMHGGSHIQRSMEVESGGNFEKQVLYDYAETSTKPKKKKKTKNPGSAYEHGWQLDSSLYNEQRDHSKRRMESHLMDSNGTGGLYGQHNAKKPKIIKQQLESTFDNIIPISGSTPSPVASQMSNMSNPNKFVKLIGGRDRGRKSKTLKMSAVQPGSGSPWSLFEDQALVVLVHDMGPNWELVSDAINSTLQFKCIFRKPKECKERHNILMDRSTGDGADSAEDSGTSQSYPSTLPGIPKGSARQLFQRLQGPMEEDTIKSHFEKIIMIGKKQQYRKSQNDNLEAKQIVAVHNSHVLALSHVVPNNLNGVVLTPLQLCDALNPDVLSLGYQSSHVSGLPMSNQGSVASVIPTSGANSTLQGSSGVVVGSHLSSPSGQQNASTSRYGVARTSLTVDEQQRMQYSHMLGGRSMQQPNLSASGVLPGADRGVRMMPGGNGMMCGMNRSMPMSRPGFQGMPSAAMLHSSSMLSSSGVGMPSSVNMHSGAGSGQGNSMLRPHEALHMIRPGHSPEHQRPMMAPDIQMQVSQANSQGNTVLNGLSSTFSNQTSPAAGQTYPGHPQQHQMSPRQSHVISNPHHPQVQGSNHPTGPQQQAYALRLVKERQMQQRFLQQQHQHQHQHRHLATSSALMPRLQPQPRAPISSSLQNSSQIQSQTQTQPVSLPPLTPSSPMTPMTLPHQQKPNMPSHGFNRNPQTGASGLNNQTGKQRQRQPQQQQFQQSGRHHPQQRQNVQSQQQAKHLKGMGRGNMPAHQNLGVDSSHLNSLSDASGSQGVEKGEQMMHLMQGQGLYSGSSLSPVQQSKPLVTQSSNHSQSQQKLFSGPTPPLSKQVQHMPSQSDCSSQSQVPPVGSSQALTNAHQVVPAPVVTSNHQQLQGQPQLHQKQFNHSQPSAQRMLQQRVNLDPSNKSQVDQAPADQQAVNSASQMGANTTVEMPRADMDSTSVVPVVPSAVAPQWKPPETLYDSGMLNPATQVDSVGSTPLLNSDGNDPIPSISHGLVQRQLSGGLPHGHNSGAQRQLHLQQSPTPQPPSQQRYQPQEQQENSKQEQQQSPPAHMPLQQMQPLQAAQGSLYIRPTNSKLE
ncbi:chromatin modification-related protein EAF1 B-like isoform X2 [Tripterygium wilfordii]|uniref:chromatin modification-related protein EAF1 B-like isoform X2 n=1 Tax=Tripterygium wilfordii TaxID=458696 RepID=UPI0018F85610|nr:chromatin modification-related protein EAF1 B-like isoform X2 [Tripterygium wilfordii]